MSAYDGAGNKAVETRTVFYEPVIDLKVVTPTNSASQVIRELSGRRLPMRWERLRLRLTVSHIPRRWN